jgi:hypothetical protein
LRGGREVGVEMRWEVGDGVSGRDERIKGYVPQDVTVASRGLVLGCLWQEKLVGSRSRCRSRG